MLVLSALACAGPPLAVPRGEAPSLSADQGFLVVHIDTELGIERLFADSLEVARDLPAGRHIWVIPVSAGSYRWSGVRFTVHSQHVRTLRPELLRYARTGQIAPQFLDDRPIHQDDLDRIRERRSVRGKGYMPVAGPDEFVFEVRAGAINYPGHLLIALANPESGTVGGISIRNRNHAAMGMRKLARTHPELVGRHPIRFAGLEHDEFLELYSRERDALNAEGRPEAGRPRGER
ncbi:MAG: hypothetical protein U0900_15640 [Myxococcota bacterium]